MKIWLLRPRKGLPDNDNPWIYPYDVQHGVVVRAATECEAREIAQATAGNETQSAFFPKQPLKVWLDSRYVTCEELTVEGEPGLVLQDFYSS